MCAIQNMDASNPAVSWYRGVKSRALWLGLCGAMRLLRNFSQVSKVVAST
jgi:hypothetical protein